MTEPKWPTLELALAVHQMLLAEHGGSEGLRDGKLLESALARPRQLFACAPGCTLPQLAASLAFGLAGNHPFVDGNKRIALTLCAVFLELNGAELDASEADAATTFDALAAGELSEEELGEWIASNARGATGDA